MDRYDDEPTAPRLPQPQDDPANAPTLANHTLASQEPTILPNAPHTPMPPSTEEQAQTLYPPQPPNQSPQKSRRVSRRSLAALAAGGAVVVGGGVLFADWLIQRQHNTSGTTSQPEEGVQVSHLLRRAGFGTNASELSMYRNLGFTGSVERLLNYQQVDDSAMEERLQSLNFDLSTVRDQQRWWLLRMAWTQRPLLEKMTLFWHGVLTSSYTKVGGPKFYERMIIQNNFLRSHAFDTFDNILLGITADPAMLFYLDLTTSTKSHPNENYARELMELFTVGVANYNQQDVTAGASALTGWHVRGLGSYYNAATHNTSPVTFMGHTGSFDYKNIISILANHPATPWFIGGRLYAFFAHENPTTADLQPLVDAYQQSGHNMGAVMRALLLSPQFSSTTSYRSRIKSPVEFVVGAYRALGLQTDGTGLPELTTEMGQTLFNPPNVAGWPGDRISSNWLNSGAWMTRLNYLDTLLVRGTVAGPANRQAIDLQQIVTTNKLSTPEEFVDYFSTFLLDGPLPSDRRSQVLGYFTATGNASSEQITLSNGTAYPLNRARGALYLIMASPEYQLN